MGGTTSQPAASSISSNNTAATTTNPATSSSSTSNASTTPVATRLPPPKSRGLWDMGNPMSAELLTQWGTTSLTVIVLGEVLLRTTKVGKSQHIQKTFKGPTRFGIYFLSAGINLLMCKFALPEPVPFNRPPPKVEANAVEIRSPEGKKST